MNPLLTAAKALWAAWRFADMQVAHGDPHIRDRHGCSVDNYFEPGRCVLLIRGRYSAVVAELGFYDHPEVEPPAGCLSTVFVHHAIALGGSARVLMSGDGARLVDLDGRVGRALRDGETVSALEDPRNFVKYNARRRSLKFQFTGADADCFRGQIEAASDHVNMMGRPTPGARFEGFFAALKDDFRGLTIDPRTGAGMFTPGPDGRARTNDDFYVSGLWEGLRTSSLTSTMSFV